MGQGQEQDNSGDSLGSMDTVMIQDLLKEIKVKGVIIIGKP